MTPKRKQAAEPTDRIGTGVRRKATTSDAFTTKAELEEMIASAKAQKAAIEAEIEEAERRSLTLVDSKQKPKRIYADGLDDFELSLAKHGISLGDLMKAAQSLELGTSTPYARLAHAVLSWWCSKPMGSRRVVWVDPASGFNERTVPKFSTAEGKDLLARGLVGAMWVSTRKQLLDARAWAKRMMQLSAAERLNEPIQLGDERLTRR